MWLSLIRCWKENWCGETAEVGRMDGVLLLDRLVSFPDPPSEKSKKGLATHMATRCLCRLYTHANQIAEFRYVTFNRGCTNSSVYSDHHGDQLTRLSKFLRENKVWNVDTEALRGNRSFHFSICVLTSQLQQKL